MIKELKNGNILVKKCNIGHISLYLVHLFWYVMVNLMLNEQNKKKKGSVPISSKVRQPFDIHCYLL